MGFILTAICVLCVGEREPRALTRERPRIVAGLAIVARNPAFFLRMVGCVLFFVTDVAIQGTLHRLVLADAMHDESLFSRKRHAEVLEQLRVSSRNVS